MKKSKVYRPSTAGSKKFTKKRMYDTVEWVEYRNRFLAANPLCYCCGSPARVVDHIVGHKGDEEKFWNETNYIPLCKICHDIITGNFDRHNPPKTEDKMKWIASARIKNDIQIKVKILPIKLKIQNSDDITS